MSKKFETLDAARSEAEKKGASFSYSEGKKNFVGNVELNGKRKKIFISKFAGNPKVLLFIREDVRRAVRELALT